MGPNTPAVRKRLAAAGLAIAVGSFLVLAVAVLAGCTLSTGGDAAPTFSGSAIDGTEVSLSMYRGKPLVLAFMASW